MNNDVKRQPSVIIVCVEHSSFFRFAVLLARRVVALLLCSIITSIHTSSNTTLAR